jgi:hypothetical protein
LIPHDETFDDTVVVPANGRQNSSSWSVQRASAADSLVGASPTIKIVDAASNAVAAAFHVDRELTAPLRAGDTIRIVRNHLGALAIAIVREDHLRAAAGAVTSIALGNVAARIPRALIEAAIASAQLMDAPQALQIARK